MRIIIADSQPQVRFALRIALEHRPGSKTINEAMDAQDLLVQIKTLCPDLALIAWELPGMPMPELIAELRKTCCNTHTIVLSSCAEAREQVIAAGVDAFVCKGDAPDALLSAIDTCLKAAETLLISGKSQLR